MKRITLMWSVLTIAFLAPTSVFAQISCSHEGLQRAVDLYIAAQTKGDTTGRWRWGWVTWRTRRLPILTTA